MTTKTHVTKVDASQVERAVQMRTDDPTSLLQNMIWWNGSNGKISVYQNGSEKVLNTRVLTADPVSPKEGETWINTTALAFKYHIGGITYSIDFNGGGFPASSNITGGYLKVLDDAELKTITDVTSAYPDYLIESFQDKKANVSLTNLEIESSRLSLVDGQLSGTYERETRTSTKVNHVEGIMVASLQGLAPKDIINNLNGTHTLKFHGNIADYFANGKKIFAFEIDNTDGYAKSIYLLDAQDKPAILNINGAASYNTINDETSVLIDNQGLDLTLGIAPVDWFDKVRFAPFGMKVAAGGNGLNGVLTELTIEEAHSIEARRILGQPNIHLIEKSLLGSVNALTVQRSPNKQYVLIAAKVERTANSNAYMLWYSTDALATIKPVDNFLSPCVTVGGAEGEGNAINFLQAQEENITNPTMFKVWDDGRFIFTHYKYSIASTFDSMTYFGKMNGASFEFSLLSSAGGYAGSFQLGAGWSTYQACMAYDDANNICAFTYSNQAADLYVVYYYFDWTNLVSYYRCYSLVGGIDYAAHHHEIHTIWEMIEGEKQLLIISTHQNGHTYGHTVKMSSVLAAAYNINIGANPAFTLSLEGGTRHQTSAFVHQLAATGRVKHSYYDSVSKNWFFLYEDTTASELWLVVLNIGRTHAGRYSSTDLTWNLVPDGGSINLQFQNPQLSLTNSVNILPTDSNSDIITKINTALSYITSPGQVSVTGSFATGMNITLTHAKEVVNVSVLNDNFTSGVNPVTTTIQGTSDPGALPVWLYWNSALNIYYYTEAQTMIPLTHYLATIWTHSESNTVADHRYHFYKNSKLWVNGDTVYFTDDYSDMLADYDASFSWFAKIPNYKKCTGLALYDTAGVGVEVYLGPTTAGATYGDRWAQIWTVPTTFTHYAAQRPNAANIAAFYDDGKLPIRTIQLYCRKNYSGGTSHYLPTNKIKLKIVGVIGGQPDESNVIAQSVNGISTEAIPQYDDYKWVSWCFDDVRLTPGQQVCLIVEGNWIPSDNQNSNPTGQGIGFGMYGFVARSIVTSNTFREVNGVWTNTNYEFWYRILDYYLVKTSQAQDNQTWRGYRAMINNWGNEDTGSTITPIGSLASKKFMICYRNHGFSQRNSDADSQNGAASVTYYGEIDDNNGQYKFPTFGPAKVLGVDSVYQDPNLMFAINLGTEETRRLEPRTQQYYSDYISSNEGYYNHLPIIGARWENMPAPFYRWAETFGTLWGNKEDSDFATGRCLHMRAQGILTYHYGEYGTEIGNRDFVIEVEVKPDIEDLTGHHVIFERWGLFSIRTNAGKYYVGLWENIGSDNYFTESVEPVINGYHIIKFGRTIAGPFLKVSTDGQNWTSLTFANGATWADKWKNGVTIGYEGPGWHAYTIGRHYNVGSEYWYGKIGYIKYAVGQSEFAYQGPAKRSSHAYKRRVQNFGEYFFGLYMIQDGLDSYADKSIAEGFLAYPDQNTSLVETNDQLFKYRSIVASGRKLAVKITLEKNSTRDPANMQGYLLNYEKK